LGGWLVWGWWGRRGDTICQHLRNLHHYYPHPRTIHHHFVMEGNNVFQGCFWPDLGGTWDHLWTLRTCKPFATSFFAPRLAQKPPNFAVYIFFCFCFPTFSLFVPTWDAYCGARRTFGHAAFPTTPIPDRVAGFANLKSPFSQSCTGHQIPP